MVNSRSPIKFQQKKRAMRKQQDQDASGAIWSAHCGSPVGVSYPTFFHGGLQSFSKTAEAASLPVVLLSFFM